MNVFSSHNRPVRVGSASVLPVSTVRDLGVYLDSDVRLTPTSLLPSGHVSRYCDKYEACGVH